MPPPMALHEITLESSLIDVAITVKNEDTKSIWIVVLHQTGCSLYEWPLTSMIHKPPTHKWAVAPKRPDDSHVRTYLQVAFVDGSPGQKSLLLLSHSVNTSDLWTINQDGQFTAHLSSHENLVEGIITNGPHSNSGALIVTQENTKLAAEALDKKINNFNEDHDLKLQVYQFPIARMESIRCGPIQDNSFNGNTDHRDFVFSLANNGSLYANQHHLARNCTSFLVTPAHLIFTTSQNLLKFAHMANSVEGTIFLSGVHWCSFSDTVVKSSKCLLTHRRPMNDAAISKEEPS